jgi:ribosomal protein S30
MPKTNTQARTIRYLCRDNAKLREQLVKKKQNDLKYKKMVLKTSKQTIKRIQTAEAETVIFRNSLKNFASTCYAQKKELKQLHKYIRRKRRDKNTAKARRIALKTRVDA